MSVVELMQTFLLGLLILVQCNHHGHDYQSMLLFRVRTILRSLVRV